MRFLRRALPKRVKDRGVNAPGRWAVPQIVFEELLVNALIHRDYFVEAPIRLFVFDDRVELVSPGALPNHLTADKIRAGNSVIRNPILASFAAKGVLPYRGLGTGIQRALAEWNAIRFVDDPDACTFSAHVALVSEAHGSDEPDHEPKKEPGEPKNMNLNNFQVQLLHFIEEKPSISYNELAQRLDRGRSTVMRHIQELKKRGVLRRIGSARSGHWEIIGSNPSSEAM